VQQQQEDGVWVADKWHTSSRFTSLESIVALAPLGFEHELVHVGQALLADQHPDGSWGAEGSDRALETSYTTLALRRLAECNLLTPDALEQLAQGERWQLATMGNVKAYEGLWLGKVGYSPYRVDRAYHLCASIAAETIEHEPQTASCVNWRA
jgi:hypothetical protein